MEHLRNLEKGGLMHFNNVGQWHTDADLDALRYAMMMSLDQQIQIENSKEYSVIALTTHFSNILQ